MKKRKTALDQVNKTDEHRYLDAQFLLVRSDDLVVLGVQWFDFRLMPGKLAPEVQGDDTRVVLAFSSYAITEEKIALGHFLPLQACMRVPAGSSQSTGRNPHASERRGDA